MIKMNKNKSLYGIGGFLYLYFAFCLLIILPHLFGGIFGAYNSLISGTANIKI